MSLCHENPILRRVIILQPSLKTLITVNDVDDHKGVPKSLRNCIRKMDLLDKDIYFTKNFIVMRFDKDSDPIEIFHKFYKGKLNLYVGTNTKHKSFRHQRLYLHKELNSIKYVK